MQQVEEYLFFFSSIIGGPVVIASASFSFGFYLTTGIIQELLIDNNDTLWLNERDIEEKLNHKIYKLLQWNTAQTIKSIDLN